MTKQEQSTQPDLTGARYYETAEDAEITAPAAAAAALSSGPDPKTSGRAVATGDAEEPVAPVREPLRVSALSAKGGDDGDSKPFGKAYGT